MRFELLRVGLRLRGDPLGVGARDLAVALGRDDDPLGLVLLHRGLLRRARLRDACVADNAREVLLAQLLDVALRVADACDRERIDVDAARLEVAARGLRDGLLEAVAVGDELLDRQRSGDRTERALEHLLDHGLDLAVRLADEPLGGGPQTLRLAGDLEHGLSRDEHADALLGDGLILVSQADLDLPRGELQPPDLVEEGPDESASADHYLYALIVRGGEVALVVTDLRAARSRDDERLIGAGDPVPLRGERREQDDDADRREDQLSDGECHGDPFFPRTFAARSAHGGGRDRTVTPIPRTPRISTWRPRAIAASDSAGRVCSAPS